MIGIDVIDCAGLQNGDREIADKLKAALDLVGVRTIDHVLVAESVYSFAEHGLI